MSEALADAASARAAQATTLNRGRRRRRLDWNGVVPAAALALIALSAVGAPLLSGQDPMLQDIAARLKPPAWESGATAGHLLGTDQLGRDTFTRLIYGGRVTLLVGFASVVVSMVLGSLLGLLSGSLLGWVDRLIMRLSDIQLAFPRILLAVSIIGMLGADVKNLIVVLGIAGWVDYARIVRAQVLVLREKEFVLAARCLGLNDWRIMFRHTLPNTLSPILVISSISVAGNIILESSLSYLGLGVGSQAITWGTMMNDARDYLTVQGWLAALPGLAIMLTVLAVNLLGDWVRDVLDPRLRT